MAWYKTGNISIVNGATAVTATGTKFASNARVGDGLRAPDGEWYEIVNIASETVLGIYPAYKGVSVTGSADYMIAPIQGYVKDSADRLRMITDGIQDIAADVSAAEKSAQDAATSATASANSATSSSTSAAAALVSQNAAKTSETNSKTSETNAATSRTQAATSATAAQTAKTNAETAELKAKAWADNAENVTVETGKYSALHWAAKAKASADAAGAANGPRLTSIAAAVLAVNDILIADTTTTMTKLATGAFGRTLLGTATNTAARTALGLGTSALTDTQTSIYDDTANRVLTVGAFGLGTSDLMDQPTNQDWDSLRATGFYQASAVGNGSPGISGQMLAMTNATWYSTQIFSPQDKTSRLFTRSSIKQAASNAPDFGAWRELAGVDTLNTKVANTGLGLTDTTGTTAELASGVNLNNVQTSGFYGQPLNANATLALNYPVARAGVLTVKVAGAAKVIAQEFQESNTGRLWIRSNLDGTWAPWKSVWDSETLVKTTNRTDTTAGNITKVGDFGLGTGVSVFSTDIADANNVLYTGWTRVVNASTNVPAGAVQGSNMMTLAWNSETIQQVMYRGARQWQRQFAGSVWTDWSEFSSIADVDTKFFNAGITGLSLTPIASVDNFDLANGTYAISSATTGTKPAGQTSGVITVIGQNFSVGRVVQTWYLTDNSATNPVTTTWKRLNYGRTWGPWTKDATQVDLDLKVTSNNARITDEAQINSSTNLMRYVSPTSNYGVIQKLDATGFYTLLTNSGLQQGNFNALRPFTIALDTGLVAMNSGATVLAPSVADNTTRVPNTTWVNTAIGNAIAGDNTTTTSLRASKYIDKLVSSSAATGAIVMNLNNATTFDYTLSGNTTLSFSNVPSLTNELLTVVVTIRQGATARTLTMPSGVTFITIGGVAIPTPAANKVQDYIFSTRNGTTWEVRAGANT